MDIYEWILIGIALATYGLPFTIGVCAANLRIAVVLAVASFCGMYAFVWPTLGPLFLPWASILIHQYELTALLILSFAGGALRAAVIAAVGYGLKKLFVTLKQRLARLSTNDP